MPPTIPPLLLLSGLQLWGLTAYAAVPDACDAPLTQAEMNRCAHESLRRAKAALNADYQRFLRRLPPESQEKLRLAQKAWLDYRDKHCALAAGLATGGSMYPLMYDDCRTGLTTARTTELGDMEVEAFPDK